MEDKDVAKVYETLLCSPGMNEVVKVELKISRKTILLLSQVVGEGLNAKSGNGKHGIIGLSDKESVEELNSLVNGILDKAGLILLNNKLMEIHSR